MDFSRLVGIPYKKGGMSESGFGCYGLVRYVAREEIGINLPEKPIGWRRHGKLLGKDTEIESLDVIFFCMANDYGLTDHIGIAVSGTEFIHASGPAGSVVQEPIRRYAHRVINVGRLGR